MPPENPYAAPQVVELGPPVSGLRAEQNQRPASQHELALLARGVGQCARGLVLLPIAMVVGIPLMFMLLFFSSILGVLGLVAAIIYPSYLHIFGLELCKMGPAPLASQKLLSVASVFYATLLILCGFTLAMRGSANIWMFWLALLLLLYLVGNTCEFAYWRRVAGYVNCPNAGLACQFARIGLVGVLICGMWWLLWFEPQEFDDVVPIEYTIAEYCGWALPPLCAAIYFFKCYCVCLLDRRLRRILAPRRDLTEIEYLKMLEQQRE